MGSKEALFCVLETGRGTGLLAFLGVAYDGFIYIGFVRKVKMERVNAAG
jgi:hypothetical protein